jgi:hypothetical protein
MRLLALVPLLAIGAAAPPEQRSFLVTSFDRLRVDGPFAVEVTPGPPRAMAEGNRRALEQVSIRVEAGTMRIGTGPLGFESRARGGAVLPTIRISTPALASVQANGGAKLRVAELRGRRVDAAANGMSSLEVASVQADEIHAAATVVGGITLAGAALRGRLRNYGGGEIAADGLTLGEATVMTQTLGGVRVRVRYTAQVIAQGSGVIAILGKPECRISGPGPVQCDGTIVRR